MIAKVDNIPSQSSVGDTADEVAGMQVLELNGTRALTALSLEVRAALEVVAMHFLAKGMNDPANAQATKETGIGSQDIPKAAKSLVAVFAGTAIAMAGRSLAPAELAASIAELLGREISGQDMGKIPVTPVVDTAAGVVR